MIEGLSLLIEDARKLGYVKGIKITKYLSLTHLLFVDDVILFGVGTYEEWLALKVLLDTFCAASGMLINFEKSCFLSNNVEDGVITRITRSLPFRSQPMTTGFCWAIGQTRVNSYASHQQKTHHVGPFGNNLRAGCSLTRNSNGVPQNQVSACREGYYCTLAFKNNY